MKDLIEALNRAHELDEDVQRHVHESDNNTRSPFEFDGKVYVYDGDGWTDDTHFEVVGKRDKIIIRSYNSSSGDADERVVSTYEEAAEFVNDVLTGYGEAADSWEELGWYLDEALNGAHELDESAAGVSTKRAGIIPGTIYKVMIKGADEFLLTERFTDIQAYLSNYASGCPSFNAVIYTMTNFRFKDIPYLYYEGGSYLNIDFSDSTAQSVIYVDGECKTQLNSENYSTPAFSHLSDYTVRLNNTVTDFNDSLLVSPRLESFKYKVVIDSSIHLFDTEQEAVDYYNESPSSRRLGNKFESYASDTVAADRDYQVLDEGTFSRVLNKIRRATLDEHDKYARKLFNFVDKFKKEFGIRAETKNAGYGYIVEGDKEIRNYRVYMDFDKEVGAQFFVDGKAYKGLKPEYASRFTMNGAKNYKADYEMQDGEIQVELNYNSAYFDLHVVLDASAGEKDREKATKRFNKAYSNF